MRSGQQILIDTVSDLNGHPSPFINVNELIEIGQREAIAACRAAVEAKLIGGALSLKGLTAMQQADAILSAIDAVEVR